MNAPQPITLSSLARVLLAQARRQGATPEVLRAGGYVAGLDPVAARRATAELQTLVRAPVGETLRRQAQCALTALVMR